MLDLKHIVGQIYSVEEGFVYPIQSCCASKKAWQLYINMEWLKMSKTIVFCIFFKDNFNNKL